MSAIDDLKRFLKRRRSSWLIYAAEGSDFTTQSSVPAPQPMGFIMPSCPQCGKEMPQGSNMCQQCMVNKNASWRFAVDGGSIADSWDSRQWPDPMKSPIPSKSTDKKCTCRTEHGDDKLKCPVHGLHGDHETKSWSIPQANPVGHHPKHDRTLPRHNDSIIG